MSAEADTRKPYPWRAVAFWLFVLLLLGVLGFFGHILYERKQAERQLEQVTTELDRDDPGWRFEDIEAARKEIPDAENGALVVDSAYGKLPPHWSSFHLEELMGDPDSNERLTEDAIKAIVAELRLHTGALAEARRLSSFHKGRYKINHRPDPMKTLLPHFDRVRAVLNLLRLDALLAAEQQEFPRALRSCEAMAGAVCSLGDEPMSISLVVRGAVFGAVCSTIERILGQGATAPEELLALQRRLEREDAVSLFALTCRAERALFHRMCTELVDVDWKSQEPDDPKEGYPRYGWLPSRDKERFIRSHALCLSLFERYLEVSRQPLSLRGTAIERVGRELDDPSLGTAVLLMGPFVRVEASDRRHHARLRCAAAMLAAERYRLKFNRWPEKIHDLRDFAAKETLIDPCDGKPLKLRREPDGLVIYSVGVNGLDDGGTAESLKGPDPLDIGFRLWDESHRRQPPVLRPPSDDGLPLGELPPQR